jgi:hypothetical protein
MTTAPTDNLYACPACRNPGGCPACRSATGPAKAACTACRRPGQECRACLGLGEIWITPDLLEHPASFRRVLIAVAEDGLALPGASLLGGRVAYGATSGQRPSSWGYGARLRRKPTPEAGAAGEQAPPARLATVTPLFPAAMPDDAARAAGDGRPGPPR